MDFHSSDFDDPRQPLIKFLSYVRDLLDKLVYGNRAALAEDSSQGQGILDDDFIDDLESAWMEVQPQFIDVINSIGRAKDDALQQHGLWGVQLRLKLRIVNFFDRQFRTKGKSALKRLLDVIDDLLDSISDVVPGAKAIGEFKDAVKNCIR